MTWTDPKTWTSEVLTSSDLNTHLRDNLNALKDPPTDVITINDTPDYTTTSTSFGNVDATDLSLVLTTAGGDVVVHFHGVATHSASGRSFYDISIDGSRYFGDDGIIATGITLGPISFTVIIEGLSAASHTINLMWKTSAATATLYAGAGTANQDYHGQFWAREMS